jgi:two-component system, OmpR family, response regulator CpxR
VPDPEQLGGARFQDRGALLPQSGLTGRLIWQILYNIVMLSNEPLGPKLVPAPSLVGAEQPGIPLSPLRAPGRPDRILLIEDDFMLRAHLAELLMSEGYQVSCAADGAEALSRLMREPLPGAIILDIVMPKLNGVSFRQRQMAMPELRAIPTIALTAIRNLPELEQLGFARVLTKPANVAGLVEALAQLHPGT